MAFIIALGGGALLTSCGHKHRYGEWKVLVNPTCETAGKRSRVCSDCGETEKKDIAATGHNYEKQEGTQPIYNLEGEESFVCKACGRTENRPTNIPENYKYLITIINEIENIYSYVYTDESGEYTLPEINREELVEFNGYLTESGEPFAISGKIESDVTIYENWIARPSTFEELKNVIGLGYKEIRITGKYQVTETLYITNETHIFCVGETTIARATNFGGDMFVIGENSEGRFVALDGNKPILTLGKQTDSVGTLVISGNRDNILADTKVVGSAILVSASGVLNLYNDVVIKDCYKVGNSRLYDARYCLDDDDAGNVGGAAIVNIGGATINMYGGLIENCGVNSYSAEELDADATLFSSIYGGAIYNRARINQYGGTIKNSSASRGGAVYNARTYHLYAGNIEENFASIYGGGIYLSNSQYSQVFLGENAASADEIKVKFLNNESTKAGGAMFNLTFSGIYCYNTLFQGNKSATSNGGAISSTGSLTIYNSKFVGNEASSKGGAVYHYKSDGTEENKPRLTLIDGCSFESNTSNRGGALYATDCEVTVKATTFAANSAIERGGAIYLSTADLILEGSTVNNNESPLGGAISIYSSSTVKISNLTADDNHSSGNGGMLYISGSTLEINDSIISNNKNSASKKNGGAIYSTSKAQITLKNVNFQNNESTQYGGALYAVGDGEIVMENVTATGNKAKKGGFVYGTYNASMGAAVISIISGNVTGNTATDSGGGSCIYSNNDDCKIFLGLEFVRDEEPKGKLAGLVIQQEIGGEE